MTFGENNFDEVKIQIPPEKVPIQKVFMMLGFAFSAAFAATNIVAMLFASLVEKYLPSVYESAFFAFGSSTIPLLLIGLPIVFIITSFIPTIKSNYKSKIRFIGFVKMIAIFYTGMMIINIASTWLTMIISSISGQTAENPLIDIMTKGGFIPTVLFGVIISPIIEEIIFRFVIINKLRAYGSGVSIFVSGFIFALFHGNLYQVFYAFAIGMVFAAIYYKTGKLLYVILLHMAVNFLGTVLPYGIMTGKLIYIIPCLILLITVILSGFIFGVIALCKTNFAKLKGDIMPKYYVFPFFVNPGIMAYMLLTISVFVMAFVNG